jgi:hypothetical protein
LNCRIIDADRSRNRPTCDRRHIVLDARALRSHPSNNAGASGKSEEPAMSSIARAKPMQKQTHLRLVYSAGAPVAANENVRREDELEERRWQLEWARRNIED